MFRNPRPFVLGLLLTVVTPSIAQDVDMEPLEIIGAEPGIDNHKLIELYAQDLAEVQRRTIQSYLGALANFETTIRSASSQEAKADLLGAVFQTVFEKTKSAVLDVVGKSIPGIKSIVDTFTAVDAEIARAAKAQENYSVGLWIQQQRNQIVATGTVGPLGSRIEQDLLRRYEALRPEDEDYNQNDFIVEIVDARSKISDRESQRLRADVVPDARRVALWLYEAWINENAGFIEFRFDEADGESAFVLESVSLTETPFGPQLEDSLNLLMEDIIPNVGAIRVKKRVCLYVEGFTYGGKTWSCGRRDSDNGVEVLPVHPAAKKPFEDLWWEASRQNFRELD